MVQGKTMCNFDCKISDLKLYLQKWEWSEYYSVYFNKLYHTINNSEMGR